MKIIIVTGRSRSIGNFYDEIIIPLKGFLKDNNIIFSTIDFADKIQKDNNSNNLYIGIFHHVDINKMPRNYIMLAMDPLDNCNDTMMLKIKNASKVLIYKKDMMNLNKTSIYYPFPYHEALENIYNIDETYKRNLLGKYNIDLLIVGAINDKRRQIYDMLLGKYKIYCPNINEHPMGLYEKDRDILLHSTKITILNNYYKNDIQGPRIVYNASNKIFFIYVLNDDDDENLLDDMYDNLIIKCNKSNLYETINYYLKNENERLENVNKLYDYIKTKHHITNFLDLNSIIGTTS